MKTVTRTPELHFQRLYGPQPIAEFLYHWGLLPFPEHCICYSKCCYCPLYTGRLFYCYILDESICRFRGVGSIFCFILFLMENPVWWKNPDQMLIWIWVCTVCLWPFNEFPDLYEWVKQSEWKLDLLGNNYLTCCKQNSALSLYPGWMSELCFNVLPTHIIQRWDPGS